LELAKSGEIDKYKKILMRSRTSNLDREGLHRTRTGPTDEIVVDWMPTDNLIHGNQEGRYFHGYDGNYCYLPLYIFRASICCCAGFAPNIDDRKGSGDTRIVVRSATLPK